MRQNIEVATQLLAIWCCRYKIFYEKGNPLLRKCTKIESTLFVPSKLTFSENQRWLNLMPLVGAVSQKRLLSSTFFVIASHREKFKHLKYSENVNFEGTNSVDSILVANIL